MKRTVWAVAIWIMLAVTAHAASFDCSEAGTPVEQMICKDADLSRLDENLSSAYQAVLQDDSRANTLKSEQRAWLKLRNRCQDIACLKVAYDKRLCALNAVESPNATDSNEDETPDCPQCGSWNIAAAEILVDKDGLRNVRVGTLEGAVGEVMEVTDDSINIPYCGSFKYTDTSSSITEENGWKYLHLSVTLLRAEKKTESAKQHCDGDKWALSLDLDSGQFDEDEWGGASLTLENSAGKKLRLHGWNPERRDVARYGTPGEGELDTFNMARAKKELFKTSTQFYKTYSQNTSTRFDVNRFANKASKYCENQYESDGIHNPSIANREVECTTRILDAKTKKIAEQINCISQPSASRKTARCTPPDETIDSSVDYTE